MRHCRWCLYAAIGLAILLLAGLAVYRTWQVTEVSGTVTTNGRPAAGATVRVKATHFQTTTDANGTFVLTGFTLAFSVHLTAWSDGYYVGGTVVLPWQRQVTVSLKTYWTTDNAAYTWIPPEVKGRSAIEHSLIQMGLSLAEKVSFNRTFLPLASRLTLGCADCHGRTINDQWAASAHFQGTSNIRLRTIYNGTDVSGQKSPPTRYGFSRDYGLFPLKPSPDEPYYGPGFKLDFPDQAGNCATCHAPTAALADPYGTDINTVKGIDTQGSHCDFCHKIAEVRLDPIRQIPYENMPGILSLDLRRPGGEPQLFFGPYDDVDVGPDTFLPLQDESRFCAPCHNASFWGIPVYQSYAEWLVSPYPAEGKSCQSCHMKPDGQTNNFAPGRGGVTRDPETVFTHNFPGAADVDLLQNTAQLELTVSKDGERILAEVSVTNENGGHDIPTDHPMRNIVLVVEANDARGKALPLVAGPVVPDWGDIGNNSNDYTGKPGKGYAKVLEELWTEVSPTAAYWRQTIIREDTRLAARQTDATRYEFRTVPDAGSVTVKARLIFRRAFKPLAQQKGWNDPDILMNSTSQIVP